MTGKKPDYSKDPTHGRPKAAGSKYAAGGHRTGPIRWAEVDGPSIKAAIDALTADGAAIVFGRTSDGGALSLTLLDGKERIKKWPNSARDAETILHEWTDAALTIEP